MTVQTDTAVRRARQTKILATVGPASTDKEMLRKLFIAGVDAFRLNFSHGSYEEHKGRLDNIRALEKELGRSVCILADMQGPKLRLGKFEDGGIDVESGHQIWLDSDETLGNAERVQMPHPEILRSLKVGENFLVDDGKVRMKVIEKGEGKLLAEVITGKKLMDRKGVNLPDTILDVSPLTPKDRKDLEYALSIGVDWVALSFVQTAEDIQEAIDIIKGRAPIMAKIEKPSAVENIDAIIELSDGIMLARGDLGVEIPAEKVPVVQKSIVSKVRKAGKPLVIATQMLESMITSPTPTRAEASDVATAVYDGADAVMLSAETAAGEFPLEAVSIMDRICCTVEADERYKGIMDSDHAEPNETSSDAITFAANQVAHTVNAKTIVTYTTMGSTALRVARQRPSMPILCLTPEIRVARRLMLSYGVRSIISNQTSHFSEAVDNALVIAKEHNFVEKGERIVVTAGVPFGTPGTTNILRIAKA